MPHLSVLGLKAPGTAGERSDKEAVIKQVIKSAGCVGGQRQRPKKASWHEAILLVECTQCRGYREYCLNAIIPVSRSFLPRLRLTCFTSRGLPPPSPCRGLKLGVGGVEGLLPPSGCLQAASGPTVPVAGSLRVPWQKCISQLLDRTAFSFFHSTHI